MKILLTIALLSALADISEVFDKIDSTVVISSRAGKDTPVPNITLDKAALRAPNPSYSLPMTLGLEPSVVSTNEGGTGVGYTSLRIRGVPGSQTIVSLNGIALNDAEDQEVFWVNIPSIAGYLGSVQVQRGLGTTMCGPGAFGAAVNMVTAVPGSAPSGGAALSYGAYHTFTSNVNASTGLMKCGVFADAAFSYNSTDGYRYGAFGNVYSVFGNVGWQGRRDLLKLTFLHGKQRTGITWEGISLEQYWKDRRFNPAEGNTDNYRQTHVQMNWRHTFRQYFSSDITLNYTKGDGYYEYEPRKDAQDNGLWVLRGELGYTSRALKASAGLYLSDYRGTRFGRMEGMSLPDLYSNAGMKREADAWLRAEWAPWFFRGSSVYAELQYRGIRHRMNGPDEYGQVLAYDESHSFVNPRVGANWKLSSKNNIFVSAAYGHREPGRADIQASSSVRPERMLDFEIGHRFDGKVFRGSTTVYAMEYFDMLVETGLLDAAGYAIKTNVPNAFRRGVEFSGGIDLRLFSLEGNISVSSNKIRGAGNILLSPTVVGMLRWTQFLWPGGRLAVSGKLVGDQYWDNSSDPAHKIPAYCVFDLYLKHNFIIARGLSVGVFVNNLFNHQYYSYATVSGVYPQAPINVTCRLGYEF